YGEIIKAIVSANRTYMPNNGNYISTPLTPDNSIMRLTVDNQTIPDHIFNSEKNRWELSIDTRVHHSLVNATVTDLLTGLSNSTSDSYTVLMPTYPKIENVTHDPQTVAVGQDVLFSANISDPDGIDKAMVCQGIQQVSNPASCDIASACVNKYCDMVHMPETGQENRYGCVFNTMDSPINGQLGDFEYYIIANDSLGYCSSTYDNKFEVVPCTSDEDCAGDESSCYCNIETGYCVACSSDEYCDTSVSPRECKPVPGWCNSDSDCAGTNDKCYCGPDNICHSCDPDEQCTNVETPPLIDYECLYGGCVDDSDCQAIGSCYCLEELGLCVDCGEGEECQLLDSNYECVFVGCTSDFDCLGTSNSCYCDELTGRCIPCSENEFCSGYQCQPVLNVTQFYLDVGVNYPDLAKGIISLTADGIPNITKSMPINISSQVLIKNVRNSFYQEICDNLLCDVEFKITNADFTSQWQPMHWNGFDQLWYGDYPSNDLLCNTRYNITVVATKKDNSLTNTSTTEFYIDCTPKVTAYPREKRVALGSKDTFFDVVIWNPASEKTYTLTMSSTAKVNPIPWMSFDEDIYNAANQPNFISNSELEITIPEIDFAEFYVNGEAKRSGTYEIMFVAETGESRYTATAKLIILAEELPEFSLIQLIVLFVIAGFVFAAVNRYEERN
ncbi:MAG: hypothetical protein ACTSPB_20435, partial [Candidatus Thorarchaeota archaeon]